MSQKFDSSSSPASGLEGILLEKLAGRMEKENRRMMTNLSAWAEILDALGWNVAMRLPGHDPLLSPRARKWAAEFTKKPLSWSDITAQLEDAPPARELVATAQLRVWTEAGTDGMPMPQVALTQRETEVLAWLREGKTGPEIAIIFGCAQRTVESHVAKIYRKLGIHHRAQLLFQTDPMLP